MAAKNKEYTLIEAIEAVGAELDPKIDIVTVKILGSAKSPIVRVYIDHPDGVSFDVLCNTQKWIGEILDKLNPFTDSYTLEVSSPGPDRPLRKQKHFEDAKGKKAKISTLKPVNERGSFTGRIADVDADFVKIALDEGKPGSEPVYDIPLELIKSANLVADFD